MSKRKHGVHVPNELRVRGIKMIREGARGSEIARTLGVSSATVSRWGSELRKETKANGKANGTNGTGNSPTAYLAKQLEVISKMIRERLPEIAQLHLTATDDGKATVDYILRQTTLVKGSVKL
jgi:transposase-like protein